MLAKIPAGNTVWIITMTRSKIQRDIAAYFQNFGSRSRAIRSSHSIQKVIEDFRHWSDRGSSLHRPDKWFSTVFYNVTGVNLVDHADKIASGLHNHIFVRHWLETYQIDANIILVRFEDVEKWNDIFGSYFPGFHMSRKNIGSNKSYARLYDEFKKEFRISQQEIDFVCGGDTMKFYSVEEKNALIPECIRHP